MSFTIDEVGIANLFIAARGRSGSTKVEDRDVLVNLLRECGFQGVRMGLEKAKEIFSQSTDAKGGCRLLSQGEKCSCFMCLTDNEIAAIAEMVNTR